MSFFINSEGVDMVNMGNFHFEVISSHSALRNTFGSFSKIIGAIVFLPRNFSAFSSVSESSLLFSKSLYSTSSEAAESGRELFSYSGRTESSLLSMYTVTDFEPHLSLKSSAVKCVSELRNGFGEIITYFIPASAR